MWNMLRRSSQLRLKYSTILVDGVGGATSPRYIQEMKSEFSVKMARYRARHVDAALQERKPRGTLKFSFALAKPSLRM